MDLFAGEFDFFYEKLWERLVERNFPNEKTFKTRKYGSALWLRALRNGNTVGSLFFAKGQENSLYFYKERREFRIASDKSVKRYIKDESYLKGLIYLKYGLQVDTTFGFDSIENDGRWDVILKQTDLVEQLHDLLTADYQLWLAEQRKRGEGVTPANLVEMPPPDPRFNMFYFGKFEIPVTLAASSLFDPYLQDDVVINFKNEFWEERDNYPTDLKDAKQRLFEYSIKAFRVDDYESNALVRIDNVRHRPEDQHDRRGKLILDFSKTTFESILATSMAIDAEILPGETLRQRYAPRPYNDLSKAVFANAPGVESIVISNNPEQNPRRQVIVRRRPDTVLFYRGFYQASSSGHISLEHLDKSNVPSPFVTAREETLQEVSLGLDDVKPSNFKLLAIALQWHYLYPSFIGYFETRHPVKTILGAPKRGTGEGELEAIPFTIDSVVDHLLKNDWTAISAFAMIAVLYAEFPLAELQAAAEKITTPKLATDFLAN